MLVTTATVLSIALSVSNDSRYNQGNDHLTTVFIEAGINYTIAPLLMTSLNHRNLLNKIYSSCR